MVERAPDHDMIFSVAVDPAHLGRGLGKRPIDFAEQRAKAAGLGEMRLYTNARMERNIALYSDLGYIETAHKPNPAHPGFTIVDMAKQLYPRSARPGRPYGLPRSSFLSTSKRLGP